MNNNDFSKHLSIFSEHQTVLLGLAYRILGTHHEAEDTLQEVFLQWQSMPLGNIDSPLAMLKTLTVRRATDTLRKVSRQRERYIGPWVPGPTFIEDEHSEDSPEKKQELADSLSIGFMMLLEQLSPSERAVYILRTGFDYSYQEIAGDINLNEEHCRQLYSRAKKKLHAGKKLNDLNKEEHKRLLSAFQKAIETQNINEFKTALADDVVLYSDGGGKAISALRPILGKEKVARLIGGLAKKWQKKQAQFSSTNINGMPGLLWRDGNALQTVVSLSIGPTGITNVYLMRNPIKIKHFA